jgi:hypothetical protein
MTQRLCIEDAKRALARAYEGECHRHFTFIDADEEGADGFYVSPVGNEYVVSLAGCSCKGSRSGYLCRHQVALADLTGLLDKFIPGIYTA